MDEKHPIAQPRERVDGNWLILTYKDNPPIRLDARLLDRVVANDCELILEVDDMRFGIVMAGEEDARRVAEALAPFTRSAPITSPEAYEYAKRRLALAKSRSRDQAAALFFGEDSAYVSDECLYIGDFVCLIDDVVRYSEAAAALPLPKGKMQAVLAMILVVDRTRTENVELLSRRIAEFESSLHEV